MHTSFAELPDFDPYNGCDRHGDAPPSMTEASFRMQQRLDCLEQLMGDPAGTQDRCEQTVTVGIAQHAFLQEPTDALEKCVADAAET